MRRLSVAWIAAVCSIGLVPIASAADLPVKAPVVAAPYNWTGFYAGVNAGGNWGTSDVSNTQTPGTLGGGCPACVASVITIIGNQSISTSGFTGGVHGGYNWQSGNLLAGIEVDFEYFRSAGSTTASGIAIGVGTVTMNSSLSTDWLFTARPRLGYVTNNWLFYGTGGLAVTKLKATWTYTDNHNAPCDCETASASTTKAGWVVGGGIEAALPGNLVVGAEYLYVNFGSVSGSANIAVPGGNVWTDRLNHSADLTSNIVRARLSKKF
jgi:outer membrane immunogenic protein